MKLLESIKVGSQPAIQCSSSLNNNPSHFLRVDDLLIGHLARTHKRFLWIGSAQHAWLITWLSSAPLLGLTLSPRNRCWMDGLLLLLLAAAAAEKKFQVAQSISNLRWVVSNTICATEDFWLQRKSRRETVEEAWRWSPGDRFVNDWFDFMIGISATTKQ